MNEPISGRRWRYAIGVLAVGLLLFAFLGYLRRYVPRWTPVPIRPLVVSAELRTVDRLPATPGALRGYNLVLVTFDTTRPDRLGCYGNQSGTSPNLDRLAREGTIFTGATATTSTTLPTHASILTGLYPQRHGARANSVYRLERKHVTLAEILSRAGYETGAFVSAFVLNERFGLAQGFDEYDDRVASFTTGFGGFAERKADKTSDLAIRWLARQESDPYFMWVHYYDPHAMQNPPSPYREAHRFLYDAEIAFADHELGRVLEAVESDEKRETLVVFVADHGEGFGEHGEWSHGYLVQEATLRVPLIIYATDGLERGIHVDTRVSQVDLMPTILSLLGVEVPSDLDGVSLMRAPESDRAVLAEAVEGRAQYGWARLAALYKNSLKYVAGPTPELYDLALDPLEREDVAADRSAEAQTMRELLAAMEKSDADRLEAASVELDAADISRLRALGYAAGDGVAAVEVAVGPDPKAMVAVMVRMQQLLNVYQRAPKQSVWIRVLQPILGGMVVDGRDDLIRQLEQLASDHPDFAPVHEILAEFYDEDLRSDDAMRARASFYALTGRK